MSWRVERTTGSASSAHRAAAAAAGRVTERTVRTVEPSTTAVVLGSAQRPAAVDVGRLAARGWELATRRSGGSAVLVGPGQCRWVDVIVPVGDPLWEADVGRGARWLGRVWAEAIGGGAEAYEGPMRATRWSGVVCMAGLAPGEVTLDGAKVVGISQRRTRVATLLQCALLERWQPADLLDVLALDDGVRGEAADELRHAAAGMGERAGGILERFLRIIDDVDVRPMVDL